MTLSDKHPPLSVRDLTIKTHSGLGLIHQVSFDVARGEILCIVGESGSGKSLTSLAIMGLLPKTALEVASGQIHVQGVEVTNISSRQMRSLRAVSVGMIFQEPMTALNPVMRTGDQVDEVLREHTNLGAAERKKKILDMFREVRLPDVERVYRSYPHQMSGGQRQRVMIAMALILEPALLIADEPTTALDVTTQKQIIRLIDDLREKHGTAVIFITHDMGVVSEIADRVLVMRSGNVVESGDRQSILTQPQQEYTRDLLRSVPSLVPPEDEPAPPTEAPVLTVSNVNKIYPGQGGFFDKKEFKALDGINFSVAKGTTLGIVGESGSGKTTIARCIMRLIDVSSGDIDVCGQEISRLKERDMLPVRPRIQIVFQDPNRSLNPRLTVGEAIIEGPTNFGVPRRQALEKAGELLELVGLNRDCLSRYPHEFSGGQRQRIAIARALAVEPEVLIADEAVSALDVSVQAQVLKLLDEVKDKLGLAVLFITHDLRIAAQICEEIIVMQNGKIVEAGKTKDVLVNPQAEYTRSLIDAAPGRGWDFANFRPLDLNPAAIAAPPVS